MLAAKEQNSLEIERMSTMMVPSPSQPSGWDRVRPHLDACQKCCSVDSSQGLLVEALKCLHNELIQIRMASSIAGESSRLQELCSERTESNQRIEDSDYNSTEHELLHNVADELLNLERAVLHIDDEVDGEFSPREYSFGEDYGWYNEIVHKLSHAKDTNDDDENDKAIRIPQFHDPSTDLSCNNHERWIDRCLDVCGYAISLEVAVDCLRRIVHHSSIALKDSAAAAATITPPPTSASLFDGNSVFNQARTKCPGLAATIASLRTIRRRLLLIPACGSEGEFSYNSFPRPFQHTLSRLDDILNCQRFCSISEYLILPLEYHLDRHPLHTSRIGLLSDSLASLALSVLPTLISAACYAKHLCLPSWTKSNISLEILYQSAWKSVLVGELFGREKTNVIPNYNMNPAEISESSSNHFQMLVRRIIESGRSNMIAGQLYKCWKSFDTGTCPTDIGMLQTPSSIFCRQITLMIESIASKREIAMFAQAILRLCVKQEISNDGLDCHLSQLARKKLNETCRTNILPFLRDILLPSIVHDAELAEAMVHFMILSPPTSYHNKPEQSIHSYPKLNAIDQAVPWCLAQLLASNYDHQSDIDNETTLHESDDDSVLNIRVANILLTNVFAVASVWCEHVFVTRTDTLQQQYVTEFLLHALEWRHLTQDDLQKSLSDDGTTLAAILVQGVSLRLDVSRLESIRVDGMRVAEVLASLLGQTLRFDELHQSDDTVVDESSMKETKGKEKRRERRSRIPKRRGLVVVDPDALVPDDSESFGSNSQSDSSTNSHDGHTSSGSVSSWGEDSLQPYDLNDDEEDLRRVPRPRNLRQCLAYLISSENDDLTYDRHQSALTELVPIIAAQPLDLHDVLSILLRILLHLEDKFNMDQFSAKRWNCLLALGIHAPYETCILLIGEMKESFAIRLEALFLVRSIVQELSDINPHRDHNLIANDIDQEICRCSTRLQIALNIRDDTDDAQTEELAHSSKTRRWRKHRAPLTSAPNRFGPISVQMIYCMFTFLSQTRTNEIIWGGSTGERFLSEFLKTLSIMLHCARTHPSSLLRALAVDLFELAWSFRDAMCADIRHAALLAVLTCVSVLPLEVVVQHSHDMRSFLTYCSARDDNADCRSLAALIAGCMSERISQNLIGP